MARDLAEHIQAVLRAGRAGVRADNAEAAVGLVAETAGETLDAALFHQAIAACLRDGLIREPLRLEANSLHCHWHLELTPLGRAQVP
jgi:hypothetical protein